MTQAEQDKNQTTVSTLKNRVSNSTLFYTL